MTATHTLPPAPPIDNTLPPTPPLGDRSDRDSSVPAKTRDYLDKIYQMMQQLLGLQIILQKNQALSTKISEELSNVSLKNMEDSNAAMADKLHESEREQEAAANRNRWLKVLGIGLSVLGCIGTLVGIGVVAFVLSAALFAATLITVNNVSLLDQSVNGICNILGIHSELGKLIVKITVCIAISMVGAKTAPLVDAKIATMCGKTVEEAESASTLAATATATSRTVFTTALLSSGALSDLATLIANFIQKQCHTTDKTKQTWEVALKIGFNLMGIFAAGAALKSLSGTTLLPHAMQEGVQAAAQASRAMAVLNYILFKPMFLISLSVLFAATKIPFQIGLYQTTVAISKTTTDQGLLQAASAICMQLLHTNGSFNQTLNNHFRSQGKALTTGNSQWSQIAKPWQSAAAIHV